MPLPFKVNPEPPNRSAKADPFLEFESERPAGRLTVPSHEPLVRPDANLGRSDRLDFPPSEPTMGLGQPRRTSTVSPSIAFGIGVAGLVAAGMAYYQLSQVLASRTTERPAAETETAAAPTVASPAVPIPAQPRPSPTPEQQKIAAAPAGTGRIDVASNPPGALVTLNGVRRGVTPFILTGLSAGRHTIVVSRGSFSATRVVELEPGEATAVAVPIPRSVVRSSPLPVVPTATSAGRVSTEPTGPSGWLTFDVPVELQVFQDGRLRGSTRDGNIPLAAGTHNIVLANAAYEYREVVSVTVTPGRATQANVPLPTGMLSVNALPWADVWVDGKAVGTTPLANLSLPIGVHEVVWKHPTLGERRQVVVVKAKTPARAGVDFNR